MLAPNAAALGTNGGALGLRDDDAAGGETKE